MTTRTEDFSGVSIFVMTDQEKYHQYELQRRNTILNYAYSMGNLGIGTSTAPGNYEDDVGGLGSTTIIFGDGSTETFGWKGGITFQTMVDSGLAKGTVTEEGPSEDFEWLEPVTEVEIGTDVTSIGLGAFIECETLSKIKIPNSVTSIGVGTFGVCTSLTSMTIPDSVTSIGNYAFSQCTSLESVSIPDSVTSIGGGAFYKCTSLTSVVIPKSVESIGSNAFSNTDMGNVGTTTGMIPVPNTLAFDGMEMDEVKGMENYSWGIPVIT